MRLLPVEPAWRLAERAPELRWLVTDLWSHNAVGIVGGEPKCCKSFLALDLAVAVAACYILLTVVLAGDGRLVERFRSDELLPLGSRIRVRLALERASPDELQECLRYALQKAGAPKLMTAELSRRAEAKSLSSARTFGTIS